MTAQEATRLTARPAAAGKGGPSLPENGAEPGALTRARIAARAVDLARRDGIAAVTMRHLAASLGAGTMSLYRHVRDRGDLLVSMLDHAAQAIEMPPPQADAREDLAQVMLAIHLAFREDPWIVGVLLEEGLASRQVMPLLERLFQAFEALRLNEKAAVECYCLLMHYTYGECLAYQTAARRAHLSQEFRTLAEKTYPASSRAFAAAADWPHDEYATNIRRLLNAIARPLSDQT